MLTSRSYCTVRGGVARFSKQPDAGAAGHRCRHILPAAGRLLRDRRDVEHTAIRQTAAPLIAAHIADACRIAAVQLVDADHRPLHWGLGEPIVAAIRRKVAPQFASAGAKTVSCRRGHSSGRSALQDAAAIPASLHIVDANGRRKRRKLILFRRHEISRRQGAVPRNQLMRKTHMAFTVKVTMLATNSK